MNEKAEIFLLKDQVRHKWFGVGGVVRCDREKKTIDVDFGSQIIKDLSENDSLIELLPESLHQRRVAEIKLRSETGAPIFSIFVRRNHLDYVESMLQSKSAQDVINELSEQQQYTPLMIASDLGFASMTELLLKYGAAVNARSAYGETALMRAAYRGHLDVVKVLLKNKASANVQSNRQVTALMAGAMEGHVEIVRFLIDSGVDMNRADNQGLTALHWAVWKEYDNVAQVLINKGMDVDSQNIEGVTPLMIAAKRGDIKLIDLLLAHGADLAIEAYFGATATEIATKAGNYEAAEILRLYY